ncbi:MacB family efflux pump subunit [Brachymonas sp. G13]|uniref:MacB family efflux pump subunit n=1 Tax=Brachymonas TaxID=28219 RepID=UPI002E791634|nr:MacB family efflux pump subunit [Brachymonas sp. J145]MEE1653339.1 MacB family efflux pump subunit [Brachymonas sp. J145]
MTETRSPAGTDERIPLMRVRGVTREYPAGDDVVAVLKDIDLDIHAGEMVAIVGASGSGKSTLMNILGCLDRATRGSYQVAGKETGRMEADELARLRREHFGFIFQRYHLMGDLNALQNVEIPAIYAGVNVEQRHRRAQQLLERLGLGERIHHRPGQLSGGQQQRVSIARALMNGGDVILADEPTGALDSASGVEVMAILKELHAAGHTIILVTHDAQVAAHAERVITISDGRIVGDTRNSDAPASAVKDNSGVPQQKNSWAATWGRLGEALQMAVRAMVGHKMRTLLTMLGIIIGIASVVSVVALGEGSRQRILQDVSSMGTNTIDVYPGTGFGDRRSGRIRTLKPSDAQALAQLNYVDSVTPNVQTSAMLRRTNVEKNATVQGVGPQFFQVRGYTLAQGVSFDDDSVRTQNQDAVIDPNTRDAFFQPGENPLGKVLLIGSVPVRVVGVTEPKDSMFGAADTLNIWLPYTTVMGRIMGTDYLRGITVRVKDGADSKAAEEGITQLMALRHGKVDFFTQNSDSIRQTVESTTQTMTLLISAIALISLIVGGIGVMNIMLVSVTERTQEIGVRMAVGARQGDILKQFLIEAVLVCLLGGVLGVLLALTVGWIFAQFGGNFRMIFSVGSIVAACFFSTLIGVLFGFLPARNAARLDPVDALSRQ